MLPYVLRRLLWTPVVLLLVSLFTFTLGRYGPGDPAQVLMGFHTDPGVVERIRQHRGLDAPFWEQYGRYLWQTLHGDMGDSYVHPGQSVSDLIGRRLWVSAQLGLLASTVGLLVGVPLGMVAASKRGTWWDTGTIAGSLLLYSVPALVLAPALQILLAVKLDWLPPGGWGGIADTRIVMPALVLAIPTVAVLARLTRASTLDALTRDYVRTARAKGLPGLPILARHVAPNALLPVVTVAGLSLAAILEGAFVTETVFGIPGVGRLMVQSLFARDYPVIMAMALLLAAAFVLANLVVDVVHAYLDPRIRHRYQ